MTPDQIDRIIEGYIVQQMSMSQFAEISEYTFEGINVGGRLNPSSDYWLLFSISLINTSQVEIGNYGSGAIGLRDGNLHINTFSPRDTGKRKGAYYSGLIENIFRRRNIGGIIFLEPNTSFVIGNDWLNHHTTVPFYTTIGE